MARILVCDDDDDFSGILCQYFEKNGHTTTRCADVQQLARVLGQEHADLLIVDMQMPGGGGPAAHKLLMQHNAAAFPVIVCSGMPPAQQAQWFKGLQRAVFLQKPLDLKTIHAAVNQLLAAKR